jgi:DNA-binding PadR family transcriptional regulator
VKSRRQLTELEGALLGTIKRLETCTAYRVRRAFLESPSAEWSGSAGAVYPAIRRLAKARFVHAGQTKDNRGSREYVLTTEGEHALASWLCDVDRAIGPGLDPFRTRAGLWRTLPRAQRQKLEQVIAKALTTRCGALRRQVSKLDDISRRQAELELALHLIRLKWLKAI